MIVEFPRLTGVVLALLGFVFGLYVGVNTPPPSYHDYYDPFVVEALTIETLAFEALEPMVVFEPVVARVKAREAPVIKVSSPEPLYTRQEAWIASMIHSVQPSMPFDQALEIARVYQEASERYQIDVWILLGKDYVESRYNHQAVSKDRHGRPLAHGWAQFIELTGRSVWDELGWEWQGVQSLYDPARSIVGGAHYLRELLDRYQGDMRYALTAYNMGPTALDKVLRRSGERGIRFTYYNLVAQQAKRFQNEGVVF